MSKRSAFKTRQRATEGILGRRKIDSHILQTRTERMAELVALSLRSHVTQEVCRELDRRGYPIRTTTTDDECRADFAKVLQRNSLTNRVSGGDVPADRPESRDVHVAAEDVAAEAR